MTYQEVRAAAKGHMGPCHVCAVCDGTGCGNQIPGPGSKGSGKVAQRNYQAWQDLYLNMDTICPDRPVDTSFSLFGQKFDYPVFAAPIGAVQNHFGKEITEEDYADALVKGCLEAGIAAFTGDGLHDRYFEAGCQSMARFGFAIPTVKPWNLELIREGLLRQLEEHLQQAAALARRCGVMLEVRSCEEGSGGSFVAARGSGDALTGVTKKFCERSVLAGVTAVGQSLPGAEAERACIEALERQDITVYGVEEGESYLTVVVHRDNADEALCTVHDALFESRTAS